MYSISKSLPRAMLSLPDQYYTVFGACRNEIAVKLLKIIKAQRSVKEIDFHSQSKIHNFDRIKNGGS